MNKKNIMFDLDDPRISSLADVISNKTCKKILDFLAENEASESEIVQELNLPANTINYNIKKLVDSGLIEKAKDFFWSVKGKKILRYRVANKKIVISPKSSGFKSMVGAVLITAIGALLVKVYYDSVYAAKNIAQAGEEFADTGVEEVLAGASDALRSSVSSQLFSSNWQWFLLGGLFALLVYFLISRLKWFR